ncbi:hypothetical protein CLOM_g560 [Closterium sp. NIES-68]|nr:hypothetical protein CLOM_g18918 [Closterium sp. NIES-68]GJP40896.1 hypothetical protein CLOM_g560 [Closterium sp. NIES-68]GJP69148.1 hypothetical protein CLOP_g106 [Closterium sp. NIES-67]
MARRYFALTSLEQPSPQGGYLLVTVGDALLAAPVPIQANTPSTVDAAANNNHTVNNATADSATAGKEQLFSGIIVDLFSGGAALPQLADETTWQHLKKHLSPGGRVLINCGGPSSSFGEYLSHSSRPTQSAEPDAEPSTATAAADGAGFKTGEAAATDTEARKAAIAAAARSDPGMRRCAEVVEAMRIVFNGQVLICCTSGSDRNIFALTGLQPDLKSWEEKLPEQIKGAAKGWSSCDDVYEVLASTLV